MSGFVDPADPSEGSDPTGPDSSGSSDRPDFSESTIAFDVLIRGAGDPNAVATVDTLDDFRPSPQSIERVRRWFEEHGCRSSVTEFGLACSAPASSMTRVFGVDAAHPETRMLPIPEPIADEVGMITVTRRPDFFP